MTTNCHLDGSKAGLIRIQAYACGMQVQRQTKQMQAIRDAFEHAARPLSIDELHELATRDIESLGQRTVYRAVRRLEDAGEIVSVPVPVEPNQPPMRM